MFGFFKSKKEIKISQLVWKNKEAKYKGLLKSIAGKENVLLLYYFNSTKSELQQMLSNQEAKNGNNQRITIEQASRLLSSFTNLSDNYICFAEHHPSFQKENTILQHLQNTCEVKEVSFYVSMDEPLFEYFGSDNIVSLIEKLGFAEDEALEHNMIFKSVVNAQKKLDATVGENAVESSTAKDWFELNVRKP